MIASDASAKLQEPVGKENISKCLLAVGFFLFVFLITPFKCIKYLGGSSSLLFSGELRNKVCVSHPGWKVCECKPFHN